MFKEVLWIQPRVKDGDAKQMEDALHSRFTRVASRFGLGLKRVVQGSVLGISLGLLNKILNPIEALEEKIKKLTGEGTDITGLAERLGASPGELTQLQKVAQSFGLNADQFKEVILKFNDSVEKANEEFANPTQEKSAASLIVAPFRNEKNRVKGFEEFMSFLRTTGTGQGIQQPLTKKAERLLAESGPIKDPAQLKELVASGQIRIRSGEEARKFFEQEVLGGQQFGGGKKLINSNVGEEAKKLNLPTVGELNTSINGLAQKDSLATILEVQNQTNDLVEASKRINEEVIKSIAASEARQQREETQRLETFIQLKQGAAAVEDIKSGINGLLDSATQGLGLLQEVTSFIPKFTSSPMFKGLFNLRGKKE